MNTTEIVFSSNKVRDIEKKFLEELRSCYPETETRMFVRMLFEEFLGWNLTQMLLHREDTVNQSDLLRFHWALKELQRFRPIQHIIGHTDFCGCRIDVDGSTLIPRPETVEMVERVIEILAGHPLRRILDLCTGSGCIAIALAKQWPEAEVMALEYSAAALEKARHNAAINGVDIIFVEADVLGSELERVLGDRKFDLIISNPPYIMRSERSVMSRNVLDYEPHGALFVPDETPLLFYQAIAAIAKEHLMETGLLALEINEALGKETLGLLRESGFRGELTENLQKDFRGKDRFIVTSKESD